MISHVRYRKGEACYTIKRESPGIYLASLMYYHGNNSQGPPPEITLIRGIRYWTGSFDDKLLLNELGKTIEQSFRTANAN
jgi:hypothetical protein